MGRQKKVAGMFCFWFSYYYFGASVCPLLRRT